MNVSGLKMIMRGPLRLFPVQLALVARWQPALANAFSLVFKARATPLILNSQMSSVCARSEIFRMAETCFAGNEYYRSKCRLQVCLHGRKTVESRVCCFQFRSAYDVCRSRYLRMQIPLVLWYVSLSDRLLSILVWNAIETRTRYV